MSDLIRAAVSAFLHPGGLYLFVRILTVAYAVSAIGRLIPVRRKQVAGYRPRKPRPVALVAGTVAVALVATACTVTVGHGPGSLPGADLQRLAGAVAGALRRHGARPPRRAVRPD